MKTWLVKIGEGARGGRPYRIDMLAEALQKDGHHVRLWTSTFDHIEKRPADDLRRNEGLHLCAIGSAHSDTHFASAIRDGDLSIRLRRGAMHRPRIAKLQFIS